MAGEQDSAAPNVRPTHRVLAQLGIEVPALSAGFDELPHPMFDKARTLASAYPKNLVRIQGIADAFVYRFTYGRWRVVVWHDETSNVLWVCACELRSDDTYDDVLALHDRRELLPDDADDTRFAKEGTLRLGRELLENVPEWIQAAREAAEELWLAMPTTTAGVPGLSPNARAFIVMLAREELGEASIWEDRYDWPTGPLLRWEVARLGITER